jgi:formamidopyrimidine-DNA glycosylase
VPELPEVEIARESLERWLRRKPIRRARVLDQRVLRGQRPSAIEAILSGARLRSVSRRGKYLIWELGERGLLLAHLGMTGKFVLREVGQSDPPAVCVRIELPGGRRVLFNDPRRFGRFQILDDEGAKRIAGLGIEPLSEAFTPAALRALMTMVRQPVKPFLLDQSRIAGLGNIHATEALFRARIHPGRAAGALSRVEALALQRAIRASLCDALAAESGAEITYLEEAAAENRFLIYGREGEPCPRCGTRIRRLVQAGRSSFFCPRCQKRGR